MKENRGEAPQINSLFGWMCSSGFGFSQIWRYFSLFCSFQVAVVERGKLREGMNLIFTKLAMQYVPGAYPQGHM